MIGEYIYFSLWEIWYKDYVHKSGLGRVIHVLLINAVLFTVVQWVNSHGWRVLCALLFLCVLFFMFCGYLFTKNPFHLFIHVMGYWCFMCDACEALDTKDVKVCFTDGKSRHSWFQGLGDIARALKPCYFTRPTFPLRWYHQGKQTVL